VKGYTDPNNLTPEGLYTLQSETWSQGAEAENKRISDLAENWISEMRGHDGECNCKHDANILQQFVEHSDFKRGESSAV
jgi:hypothetical protein